MRAITVQEIVGGWSCKYTPDDLSYADGSEPSSDFPLQAVPNGQSKSGISNKPPNQAIAPGVVGANGIDSPPASGKIRFIDMEEIDVSSGQSSKGNLLDYSSQPSFSFWASSFGGHPHIITLTLKEEPSRSKLFYSVELFGFNHGGGYDPVTVNVLAGADLASAVLVNSIASFPSSNGWIEIASPAHQMGISKTPPRVIKIEIHPAGSNCKVSGLRLVTRGKFYQRGEEQPLVIGDRVTLADNFAGGTLACLLCVNTNIAVVVILQKMGEMVGAWVVFPIPPKQVVW